MELYWEPRKQALSQITPVEKEPEMSEFESAFVCGLIKEKKPKKILEIGVAAGGTTAIILQCVSMLDFACEVISADLNEKFYRGDGRQTGFIAREFKEKTNCSVKHRFILGKVIAETIDEIGGDIDLVVLDTVHCLPGELLDFIAILPYLAPNAYVILHDVAYHHYHVVKEGVATQVLLDTATGEKLVPMRTGEGDSKVMPNIAAIKINSDTSKYIGDVFRALTLPWNYLPGDNELKAYKGHYKKFYDKSKIECFDVAVELNKKLLKTHPKPLPFIQRIICSARMLLLGY